MSFIQFHFLYVLLQCSTSIQPGWFVILIQHDGKLAFGNPIVLWGQAVEDQVEKNKQDKSMKAGPVDFKIPRSYLRASHSYIRRPLPTAGGARQRRDYKQQVLCSASEGQARGGQKGKPGAETGMPWCFQAKEARSKKLEARMQKQE